MNCDDTGGTCDSGERNAAAGASPVTAAAIQRLYGPKAGSPISAAELDFAAERRHAVMEPRSESSGAANFSTARANPAAKFLKRAPNACSFANRD